MNTATIIAILIYDTFLFALPVIIAWQTSDKSWLWLLIGSALLSISEIEKEKNKEGETK